MLKRLLLFATAFAVVLPAFAQHQRRVLIEEFTNASCPPCAAQNPAFNATIAANIDYLAPIKYQTNWPGYDPMNEQNPSEVATRVSYYGVTGVPNGRQNGILEVFPMTTYSAAMIQDAYNTLTPVTMVMTHSISPTYDSVFIHLEVTSDSALSGTLRLRVAVVEEEVFFDAPPGSNGEKEFFQIMRKMLPDATGTATGDFAAGEKKTYDFSWPIGYAYDLNKISVIGWLQEDASKEVFQSAHSLPIGGIPTVGIQVNSAYTFNCTSGVSPKFALTNTAATNLTNAVLRYRINNGTWTDYAWTGDLAPSASTEITLTDLIITTTGTTKVDVEVVSSNNGIQTNLVGAISTINTRSLLDPASAIPFLTDFQAATSIPASYTVVNPGTNGWKMYISGVNRSTRCNMYDIPENNKAYLATPKIDLTQASGPSSLRFDHAYTYYNASFFDSLRVEVSANCGETWTTVFHDGKDGLATVAPKTTAYAPANADWRKNELDLSSFNGSEVIVRFTAESGYGNNLFLDNINVSLTTGVKELELTEFSLSPNPTRDVANLRFSLVQPESVRLMVFNAIGALVQSQELGELSSGEYTRQLDATNLNSGTYRVVLQGKEGLTQTQWVIVK